MVDVGRNDGSPPSHLVADEFRGHFRGNARPQGLSRVLGGQLRVLRRLGPGRVFPEGDELHLRRDDTPAGLLQPADVATAAGAPRKATGLEALARPTVIGGPDRSGT